MLSEGGPVRCFNTGLRVYLLTMRVHGLLIALSIFTLIQFVSRVFVRDVAGELNLKSGVAVSCQLRKLHKVLAEDTALKAQLDEISEKLQRMVSGLNLI
jgi:predicted neutral ceramidase superfamily lipid hydrolase